MTIRSLTGPGFGRVPSATFRVTLALCCVAIGLLGVVPSAARASAARAGASASAAGLGAAAMPALSHAGPSALAVHTLDALPLSFETNRGQVPASRALAGGHVDFVARGRGYTMLLSATGALISLTASAAQTSQRGPHVAARLLRAVHARPRAATDTAVLRLQLVGANPRARGVGLDRLPGATNYLIGRDSRRWHTGIATYGRVAYKDVYPGIDLVYYGNGGQLEYDYVVAPGADPQHIRLGIGGARHIGLDRSGNLVAQASGGVVRLLRPVVYQQTGAARRAVSGGYALLGHGRVGLRIGTYDHRRPLIVDPVLGYATYLGGGNDDYANGIAVDGQGNTYVVGVTGSADFTATTGASQTVEMGTDNAFVTELSVMGTVIYQTYLGGGGDAGNAIAVDAAGDAYLTGATASADFPTTTNAFSRTSASGAAGTNDAFVAELNPTGSGLIYSTYLGGGNDDFGQGIARDGAGNVYVAGQTTSVDFPITNALQTANNTTGGAGTVFVAEISPTLSGAASLRYSTYLGGTGSDTANGLAVDAAGDAYLTGLTSSSDFTTTAGAFQRAFGGGGPGTQGGDAFLTEIAPNDSRLVYSTYLGGGDDDQGDAVAIDAAGDAYVTGLTYSSDFPTTPNAFQRTLNLGETGTMSNTGPITPSDAFVSEINPALSGASSLLYSSYLGGGSDEEGHGIAVDSLGEVYVAGQTASTDFPTQNPIQAANSVSSTGSASTTAGMTPTVDTYDAFVTKFLPNFAGLDYSTYLGGNGDDGAYAIAISGTKSAYVDGFTDSTTFPVSDTVGTANHGNEDAFALRIDEPATVTATTTPSPSAATSVSGTPSASPSAPTTGTATATASASTTGTATATATGSATATATGSATTAAASTSTPTSTATTATATTPTATNTGTTANTPTATATTPTATATMATATATATTATATGSATTTATGSATTPAATDTTTSTAATATAPTATNTGTTTATAPTATNTGTTTNTSTATATTATSTATVTAATATTTPSPSAAASLSGTPSASPSATGTASTTGTATTTATGSATTTATGSATTTAAATGTPTRTATTAATNTATSMPTPTATMPSATNTATTVPTPNTALASTPTVPMPSATNTGTPTGTPTSTPTSISTSTSTSTSTSISTSTSTGLPSATSTASAATATLTGTVSAATATGTAQSTQSALPTMSQTPTTTVTPALTARFYFAGGVNLPSQPSFLDVTNPEGRPARVGVTFYDTSGAGASTSFTVGAAAHRTVPIAALTRRRGLFGLVVSSDRTIAAGLTLTRPGRDDDVLTGATAPRRQWYLAEGYTGLTFHETVSILNPGTQGAHVTLRLLSSGRTARTVVVPVGARREAAVDINRLLPGRAVSVVATSDRRVVVERTLTFGRGGYGMTTRIGATGAATVWLFAEGTTVNRFETYLTVLNPTARTARVTARFYGRNGALLGGRGFAVGAGRRNTLRLNDFLAGQEGVASIVTADRLIVVERPEYFGPPNAAGIPGSDVFGLNATRPRWSFAGGDTSGRSEFLLLFNPGTQSMPVRVTVYSADGRAHRATVTLTPRDRYTLNVGRTFRRLTATHGEVVESTDGRGFVAEQTVFAPDHSTLRSTEGLPQ